MQWTRKTPVPHVSRGLGVHGERGDTGRRDVAPRTLMGGGGGRQKCVGRWDGSMQ